PYTPDGVPGFTPETPWPEPFAAIAAMAAVTSRLRFATMVYILPLRHPVEVAKACATLDVLTGGRFVLGAGAGWMKEEFDQLGVDFATRGARFDEAIEVLRKLWRPGMAEHHGRFFELPRMQMSPAPRKSVPIYVGGGSAAAFRRAARLGDGWLGAGTDPEQALRDLATLARLRAEAGRARAPFEAIVPLTTPPDPAVLRRLEEQGAHGTVSYPFLYALGRTSSLDQKRRYLEGFAENVIRKLGQQTR
ncbi:MAG TPA: TIGR03619 family F420-dependent LLM class oxidoreductase, partial [Myxococcota bacterium]|nr:TIGR03619 family F420-dependent LLM class oxidoreductase [Myxococcota bacterium]